MKTHWAFALVIYLCIGAFVCMHARDKDGRQMPVHHYLLIVPFWPLLFLTIENGDDQ